VTSEYSAGKWECQRNVGAQRRSRVSAKSTEKRLRRDEVLLEKANRDDASQAR